eukprot:gb/GFBE01021159.1/.p1 GENE.gb/GFBE01021159.1/~~gb/GFBE01021159.1/.p1  ORF type:complete len:495 (+),score=109.41 gb/GFBE01021159.1/:1-1485(+)
MSSFMLFSPLDGDLSVLKQVRPPVPRAPEGPPGYTRQYVRVKVPHEGEGELWQLPGLKLPKLPKLPRQPPPGEPPSPARSIKKLDRRQQGIRLPKVTNLANAPKSPSSDMQPFNVKTHSAWATKVANQGNPHVLRECDESEFAELDQLRSNRLLDFIEKRHATSAINRKRARLWRQRRKRLMKEAILGQQAPDEGAHFEEEEVQEHPPEKLTAIEERKLRRRDMLRRRKLRGMRKRLKAGMSEQQPKALDQHHHHHHHHSAEFSESESSGDDSHDDHSDDDHQHHRRPSAAKVLVDQQTECTFGICIELAKKHSVKLAFVRQCVQEFQAVDNDGNGAINREEFNNALRRRCSMDADEEVAEHLVEAQWKRIDRDGSGQIEFEEYLLWALSAKFSEELLVTSEDARRMRQIARELELRLPEVERLKSIFDMFDVDGSGGIDKQEFAAVVMKLMQITDSSDLLPSVLTRYWREADINNDGAICFEEFLGWYLRMGF